MIEFIYYFALSFVLVILSFVYWDTLETQVMNVGERIEDIRDAIAKPNAKKAEVFTLARPLIIGALLFSTASALLNTY